MRAVGMKPYVGVPVSFGADLSGWHRWFAMAGLWHIIREPMTDRRARTVCGFEPPVLVVERESRMAPPLRNEARCVVCVEARRLRQTVEWAA